MHPEAGIEAARFVPGLAPDCEGGAGGPRHVAGVVVLAAVGFERVEDSAAREREAVAIQKSARGARVLERGAVELEQLGLHGAHARLCERGYERPEPVGLHLDIVVEEHQEFASGVRHGFIVAACEEQVFAVAHDDDLGVVLGEPRSGSVARGVVGHDDFQRRVVRGKDRGQEALQKRQPVPGDNDDGDERVRHGSGGADAEATETDGAALTGPTTNLGLRRLLPQPASLREPVLSRQAIDTGL